MIQSFEPLHRARAALAAFALALVATPAARAADEGGEVKLPLDEYTALLDEVERDAVPERAPFGVLRLERRIEGEFEKGVFSARLVERFEVIDDRGHVRVPVLDGTVSLGDVRLDGARTSLLAEGGMYTVGVDEPGVYEIRLEFFWGEDRDRFERRLEFALPEGGVTRLSVLVPEREIEPRLARGALTRAEPRPDGTLLEGYLEPAGGLELTWSRRLTHRGDEAVSLEAAVHTLFTLGESAIGGKAVVDIEVIEGETDVIELVVPAGIEIVGVEGEAVLQWRTEARDGGRLRILLRYLLTDRTRISVHFQAPAADAPPLELEMPLPPPGVPFEGTAGVQGPAGLAISVAAVKNATELGPRDLPPALAELSSSPINLGFSFFEQPTLRVAVARHEQVELTSTVIEELQASTVVGEDGIRVTKMKLRVRNNVREYLGVRLPDDAVLTHCLIDGRPVRPALGDGDERERLLVPLRQSERIREGEARTHTVRPGETLSDIANFYYSDPSQYEALLAANPHTLTSAHSVAEGMRLRVPTAAGAAVEESSFVVELAYKERRAGLGAVGRLAIELPELDVDTMRAVWHLYLPEAFAALDFEANLTQYSAIRYDPFRRARDFIERAMWIQHAWAGGEYENILAKRRVIYDQEATRRSDGEAIRAAFPLVGERYRFCRILLGRETPAIAVTYATRELRLIAHFAAFAAAFVLALALIAAPRSPARWIAAAAGLAALLLLAHYVLGVHRRIVWGADAALLIALLRLRAGPLGRRLRELARSPWRIVEVLTLRNLAFAVGLATVLGLMVGYPLFVSLAAGAALIALLAARRRREAREEVPHA